LFFFSRFLRNQLALSRENEVSYFYKFHAPSHLNAGNYIAGLIFGFVYLESKDKLLKMKKSWPLEVFWHCCWISTYIVSMLGFPFIESDVTPSIWTALFGGFMKHYHGFLMGFLLLGLVMRLGWIVPKVFNLPVFRVLGRIMYSYYLSHIFVLRLFVGGATQPFEVNIHFYVI
jgi:peptidoglycan/LPS O-acetylase OafA/YrhL